MAPKEPEELELDEDIDEEDVLVPYDIATYPSDMTLSVINEMWHNGDILIPEFQRNFVWSLKQSSLLIESFLLGLPVPQIFLYIDDENKNLVIDGQQRLLSIVYYFEGYFGSESIHGKRKVFRLTGLDERSPYAKKRFDELEESAQRKLKNSVLRAINVRQLSPVGQFTSIYHIFERLNTGGTPLKPQEIRNCVFRGDLVRILRELNTDDNWRKILGKSTFDVHQKDVELVLRIFALSGGWHEYEKPLKEFLNKAMEHDKKGTSARVNRFISAFPQTTRAIVATLGERPFHLRGPLNTAVLDSVFCTILENVHRLPLTLRERYERLRVDEEFQASTFYGTSDVSVLARRFELAHRHLISED